MSDIYYYWSDEWPIVTVNGEPIVGEMDETETETDDGLPDYPEFDVDGDGQGVPYNTDTDERGEW